MAMMIWMRTAFGELGADGVPEAAALTAARRRGR
jgi:hypothetical protein